MAATLIPIDPRTAAERLKAGVAHLVDVREADEFARRHVKGAVSRPLSLFDPDRLPVFETKATIFTCRTGMRTNANCDRLASAVSGEAYVLSGGIDAWAAAGLEVEEDRVAPLEMMRQVQIAAGALILLGVALGFAVNPGFFALAGLVGLGLTVAGLTGYCGMARVLAFAPWNQARAR